MCDNDSFASAIYWYIHWQVEVSTKFLWAFRMPIFFFSFHFWLQKNMTFTLFGVANFSKAGEYHCVAV